MRPLLLLALLILAPACDKLPTTPIEKESDRGLTLPSADASSRRIPGQYIVVFHETSNTAQVAARLAAKHGATVRQTYTSALNGMSLSLSASAAAALAHEPEVASVEQDEIVTESAVSSTSMFDGIAAAADMQASAPWHLDRVDQTALPLDGSYSYATDGSGVRIYVIGAGIRYSHSEFGGRAVPGIDLVAPNPSDCDASTFGAGVAGGNTFGVAKGASLVSVRASNCNGSVTVSTLIAAVDWVTANRVLPAVASLTTGFSTVVTALNSAVENSIASGITWVVPAGGVPTNACTFSPPSAPDAITVGTSRADDSFGVMSNYGPCITLNAPGHLVTSSDYASDVATTTLSGTAVSSAMVAGAAALYLSAYPTATPGTVRAALLNGATSGVLTALPAGTANLLLYTGGNSVLPQPATAAKFTYTCSGLTCTFYASSSVNAISSSWNFGDATSGSGVAISHKFPKPKGKSGSYTVTLTIVDGVGITATLSKTITCTANSCS